MYILYSYELTIYDYDEEKAIKKYGITFANSFSEALKNIKSLWQGRQIIKISSIKEIPNSEFKYPIFSLTKNAMEIIENETM